jgi:hypothetical protein
MPDSDSTQHTLESIGELSVDQIGELPTDLNSNRSKVLSDPETSPGDKAAASPRWDSLRREREASNEELKKTNKELRDEIVSVQS